MVRNPEEQSDEGDESIYGELTKAQNNMIKIIYSIFISLIMLAFSMILPVAKSWASDYKTIELSEIKELAQVKTEDLASSKLLPVPTPSPQEEEKAPKDRRSWTKSEFSKLIAETASKYDLDPQLIYATIMTESRGNPKAYRFEPRLKDASLCLGQILTSTARLLGFRGEAKELYKPEICIDLIGKYHRTMLDRHGDLSTNQLAAAYNTGSPRKRPIAGYLRKFNGFLED
ncbi:hypothetical protein A3D03_05905 [Candidatus Gottesmanbacteria bacterium RIFCSPHIGHO2_02_FULL_40_13]|uniref:Transglycosylase SLT domain-containing protein n=1 Tax=Candidatus Gottesmanbacteria bacterium RIFCSPHIGHO2_02_FULL_40_13 TaxID=1798384 RepID=A0A1F6ACX7_9BACT|nr:MAG: hypothetical protein A3D03_05905 [Candidatus Gottesmanbacteria bacterium RIFCSPHIGHO2_02_FULL_40_13]